MTEFRSDRRDFLKRSATAVAGASIFPLAGARAAFGGVRGELGLIGTDHVGLTVPDIGEAVAWFEDVLGARAPLSFGPIADPQGTLMQDLLGVDPRSVIDQITVLRVGHSANIELFQYEAPDQRHSHPRNSDWSGHHVAFYVTDIEAAIAYMDAKGVERFFGPFSLTDGPAAGQSINYFHTPFGTDVELISYPHGMAYEDAAPVDLWNPRDNHPARGGRGHWPSKAPP